MSKLTVIQIEAKIKACKERGESCKLYDGNYLWLRIGKTGSASWTLEYKKFSKGLGSFKKVSLKEARKKAKAVLMEMKGGTFKGRTEKFSTVAEEWLDIYKTMNAKETVEKTISRLDTHILPKLGHKQIGNIGLPEVTNLLMGLVKAGKAPTADKVYHVLNGIFKFAVTTGVTDKNIMSDIDKKVLGIKKTTGKHHAFTLNPWILGAYLHGLWEKDTSSSLAALFAYYTTLRSKSIRLALIDHVKLDETPPIIYVPEENMKGKNDFIQPLSRQVVEIVKRVIDKQNGHYLFPNKKGNALSRNAMLAAMKNVREEVGIPVHITIHGGRHSFSTLTREYAKKHGVDSDALNKIMSHVGDGNAVIRVYDHSRRIEEKAKALQWWADFLDDCIRIYLENPKKRP